MGDFPELQIGTALHGLDKCEHFLLLYLINTECKETTKVIKTYEVRYGSRWINTCQNCAGYVSGPQDLEGCFYVGNLSILLDDIN